MSIDQLLDAPMNVKDMTTEVGRGAEKVEFERSLSDIRTKEHDIDLKESYERLNLPIKTLIAFSLFRDGYFEIKGQSALYNDTQSLVSRITEGQTLDPNSIRAFSRATKILESLCALRFIANENIDQFMSDKKLNEFLLETIHHQWGMAFVMVAPYYQLLSGNSLNEELLEEKWDPKDIIDSLTNKMERYDLNYTVSEQEKLSRQHKFTDIFNLKLLYPDKLRTLGMMDNDFIRELNANLEFHKNYTRTVSKDYLDSLLGAASLKSKRINVIGNKIVFDFIPETDDGISIISPLPTIRRFGK